MLIGSIALLLAAILFVGFLLSSLAMAQQQITTMTTTSSSPPSLSTTPITPPLTPEEQEQQIRLQNVIAATTRNLEETEKQVNGIVYTPRWSNPVWVNANSLDVLVAYCLPGEFADSGQEILGGFELEVLESYAVALPQGFMAWMAIVGNQDEDDVQNGRRLPAAVGVICASDLNNADTRILSPQEQQQINNINQQFVNIQNTQVTNIDQVINIINNVTTNGTTTGPVTPPSPPPPTNDTGTTPPPQPPPTNDTGGTTTEEQPLTAEIIANPTQAYAPATIRFDYKATGGTPPYRWVLLESGVGQVAYSFGDVETVGGSMNLPFFENQIGTHTLIFYVLDRGGTEASDSVQITILDPLAEPGGVLPPPETGEEGQPPGGGLLPGIAPGGEEEGEELEESQATPPSTTEEEEPSPPTNVTGGG